MEEMEMRASEDIHIYQDLNLHPLPPITHALHRAFLSTHFSTCFSPTTPSAPPPSSPRRPLLPADHRAVLLLLLPLPSLPLHIRSPHQPPQAIGNCRACRSGGGDMLHARRLDPDPASLELAARCLCLVITNAVDREGRAIGIAVYGPEFSWVNHSCFPNACYRFVISPHPLAPPPPPPKPREAPPRIVPALRNGLRWEELWSKHCFRCCCRRCCASPALHVARLLEEIFILKMGSWMSSADIFSSGEASEKLTDYVEYAISLYLSEGDAEYCCEKLETMLVLGLHDKNSETRGELELIYCLHPVHHHALNAYMTLASAYKIRACDLSVSHLEDEVYDIQALDMSKTSAAYSLLLATASYYLFCHESSIIASVANFWANAGELLLALARNLRCGSVGEATLNISDVPSIHDKKCRGCSLLLDQFSSNYFLSLGENVNQDRLSGRLLNCIGMLSQEVWSFLIQGCDCLKMFETCINFGQLGKFSNFWDFQNYLPQAAEACLQFW